MLKIGIDNGHGTGFKCKTSSLIFSNINIFFCTERQFQCVPTIYAFPKSKLTNSQHSFIVSVK